jgi:hypothetical protein
MIESSTGYPPPLLLYVVVLPPWYTTVTVNEEIDVAIGSCVEKP